MRLLFLCILLMASQAHAWDNEELEIFDLVEEVNQNFYEYLELTQEASTSEIRKAYRRLSLILHPDKNDAEDASIKFRWLASIYEILKDTEKRAVYDRVLVEGLPDWRSPVFYYRRMRKIGLAEGLAYLFVIVTVFQYCIYWAHYWERKFTLKEVINDKMAKKAVKKGKKATGKTEEEIQEMLDEKEAEVLGPKPTIYDTLPFQTCRLFKSLAISIPLLPWTIYGLYKDIKAQRDEEERLQREEEEEALRREEEKRERKERKKERKRIVYDERQGSAENQSSDSDHEQARKKEDIFKQPRNANQIWTDVDLAKLAKLMKKYPAGTPDRWDRIAEMLERLPWEVTKMAKKIKDNSYMVPVSRQAQGLTGLEDQKMVSDDRMESNYNESEDPEEDSEEDETEEDSDDDNYGAYSLASKPEEFQVPEVKTKKKTRKADGEENIDCNETTTQADPWSQAQQKALETALVQFPKGTTERWERIANKVPGKTKDQCIQRFKTLAEMVKKKREGGGEEEAQ